MNLAPVAIFAYKRPGHLQQVLDSLRSNPEASRSEVFLYLDAAKSANDAPAVEQVRKIACSARGFRSVHIIERERNLGLSVSITEGVTQLCKEYGRVAVLEDDVVVSRYFLDYVNRALDKYEFDERVISIGCYVFPISIKLPETFFLRITDCWGWAVWKRSWDLYEADGAKLFNEMAKKGLTQEFDFEGAYPYSAMLAAQAAGRNDSWAVRWYARAFLLNRLTLYPGRSVTRNIGMDGSGTHGGRTSAYAVNLATEPVLLNDVPVCENDLARNAWKQFLRQTHGSSSLAYHVRSWLAQVSSVRVLKQILEKRMGQGYTSCKRGGAEEERA